MILRLLCRGGFAALTVLAFAVDLLVNANLLPGVIFAPIAIATTILLRRANSWPPYALLRDIDKAVPGGRFHILVNEQAGVRFVVARPKGALWPSELVVGRFTDRDISESYSDANLGASITTVPVETFRIHGRAMVARTLRPLVATFEPADVGMIVSFESPPGAAGFATRRAAVRAVVDQLRFQMRSGVGHVTDEEIAELAGQLRGASIDPNIA